MIKQVIIIRKDLNMRKGKMCAQVAHASMKVLLDRMTISCECYYQSTKFTPEIYEWLQGKFTKIVVGCDSEQELVKLYEKAVLANLPCAIITDCGATEFKEPTLTAVAIGAAKAEEITGGLKLL